MKKINILLKITSRPLAASARCEQLWIKKKKKGLECSVFSVCNVKNVSWEEALAPAFSRGPLTNSQ